MTRPIKPFFLLIMSGLMMLGSASALGQQRTPGLTVDRVDLEVRQKTLGTEDEAPKQPNLQGGAATAGAELQQGDLPVFGGQARSNDSEPTRVIIGRETPAGNVGSPQQQVTTESAETPAENMPVAAVGSIEAGVALSGRITDPAGQPVTDITVKAMQGEVVLVSMTDDSGYYHFALPQGIWSVSASDLDYDITPAQKVYEVLGASVTRIE